MLFPNPHAGDFETNDSVGQGEHTAGGGGEGRGLPSETNSGPRAGLSVEHVVDGPGNKVEETGRKGLWDRHGERSLLC